MLRPLEWGLSISERNSECAAPKAFVSGRAESGGEESRVYGAEDVQDYVGSGNVLTKFTSRWNAVAGKKCGEWAIFPVPSGSMATAVGGDEYSDKA